MSLDLSSLFLLPTTTLLLVNGRSHTAASESYIESWGFFSRKAKQISPCTPNLINYFKRQLDFPKRERIQE